MTNQSISELPLIAAKSKFDGLKKCLEDDPDAQSTIQVIDGKLSDVENNLHTGQGDTCSVFDMVSAVGALNDYHLTNEPRHLYVARSFCKTTQEIKEEYLEVSQTGEYAL